MPALKPSLLLDFANSRQLGPLVTFTRASTATRFNRLGLLGTVPSGAPRFDFDPVTLACRGLLIEEARTNLLVRSAEFNTTWAPTRASISADATTAPDGTVTADKLIDSVDAETSHYLAQTISHTGAHSFAIYGKAAELSGLMLWSIGATSFAAGFNLATGTTYAEGIGGVFPPDLAVSMVPVGGGWYRCAMSFTAATGTSIRLLLDKDLNGDGNYTGDGTSGLFIWGAQLEAGAFPTSYIPTAGSQVTRAADVASIAATEVASFWRANRGTLVSRHRRAGITPAGGQQVVAVRGSSASFVMAQGYGFAVPSQLRFDVADGGVTQASLSVSTSALVGVSHTVAAAYADNDFAASLAGGTCVTDTGGTVPAVTFMALGISSTLSSNWLNGWLERIAYYPERLSNADLQALSAA